MRDLLLIAAMLGFYPFMVLCIAVTGPHNETERREKMMRRLSPPTKEHPHGKD